MQGWVLPYLIAWVESRNVNASSLRRLFGRTRLVDPDVRIPEAVTEMAWRLAATLTGDEALGIHLAESLPRGALDLIEYALRSSPSLGKGLDRLACYGRLLSDRVAARTHSKGESLLFLVHDTATTPLHPARAEFALAVALKLARDSTGADITPVRVGFAHPAPDNVAEHRRFFHGRVRFAAGSSSMILSASDASRPMHEADAALAAIIRRRLENALGDRSRASAGAMSTRVRHMVVEHLGRSTLTLDAVATALAVSRRTLTRRLAEERASFSHILDEVRSDFARALLQDRSLGIGDIAFFLQYSEPAAFHRSFRRWTGRTPRAFREA
jgi:AraC-like DNA-binding protein